jgi:hypothetical protein
MVAPVAASIERAPKAGSPAPPAPVERDGAEIGRQAPALRMIASVGAAYGLLPELAGILAIGVELPGSGLRVGVGALVTSQASTGLAGGMVVTRLAGARAYGCAGGEGLALDLQACAGLALGVVSGSGRDFEHSADATGTLLAPFLRLGTRYPARGLFAVGLALEGLVPFVRPELQVSGNAGAASPFSLFATAIAFEAVLALP